jgi:hypothetical protein
VTVVVEVTRLIETRPLVGVSVAEGQVAPCHEVPLPYPLFDPDRLTEVG